MTGRIYSEQVLARHGNGRYTIELQEAPLYLQGYAPVRHKPRFANLAAAPRIPLHQLGWLAANPAAAVSIAASVGTKVATPSIVAATGATGIAAGALTAGIGAGVAILVGVLAGLWAKHEARIKGAKAENQAINSAVQTFDAGIKAIFAAANSSDPGVNVPGPAAASQVQQLYSEFWAQMAPFTHSPGAADASGGGANCGNGSLNPGGPCTGTPGGHMCDKTCTATCCVGCQDLYPTMLQAVQVLNSPTGGTVQVCTVYGSKYGANMRAGYSLTYTPPKLPTVASTVNTVATDVLSALTGGSIVSDVAGAMSSNKGLIPIALVGLALWFFS